MKDSLNNIIHKTTVILDTVSTSSASSLDLLTRVDTFYSNAWTKLIATLGLITVLIPIGITFFLNKQLSLKEAELQDKIKASEDKLKVDIKQTEDRLISEIENRFEKKLLELKTQIDEQSKMLDKLFDQKIDVIEQEVSKFSSSNINLVYLYANSIIHSIENKDISEAQDLLKDLLKKIYNTKVHDIDKHFALYGTNFMSKLDLMRQADTKKQLENYIGSVEAAYKEFHTPGTYGIEDKGGYPNVYSNNA